MDKKNTVIGVLLLIGAFGAFYAAALVAKRIPVLDRAISSVLQYADQGNDGLVVLTTLANGAAEEVFFRGALYAAVGERRPVVASTGVYMLATVATRNPALVLASGGFSGFIMNLPNHLTQRTLRRCLSFPLLLPLGRAFRYRRPEFSRRDFNFHAFPRVHPSVSWNLLQAHVACGLWYSHFLQAC